MYVGELLEIAYGLGNFNQYFVYLFFGYLVYEISHGATRILSIHQQDNRRKANFHI